MIDVQHLTKNYPGGVTAVDDVSFSIEPGEIVGFLGPNGAGKSTTMRILAGYLSPSGGQVKVKGMDVTRKNLEVRQCLGYLPETCPLYTEMRVGEYLRYRADLKGLSRRHRRTGVERAMEQCGLLDVQKRLVGQLSKGFRQRVGIADALVHNPDLLILDEPTIGLDPNQIVQVRKLIRDLSSAHTLLISSHILSEIEATCNRVVVMNQGKILESASLEELGHRWSPGAELTLEVKASAPEVDKTLRSLADLKRIQVKQDGAWAHAELLFANDEDHRERVFACIKEADWDLRELHARRHSLEETFVKMTGGGEEV
ncbi:ATP-binding cassette domain-containing protein [Kiritimatiellaeota bacterium B1221]|nr:ATP-binding cassette domain-containing protein [Kiritimatiellaeota bacterium B1221]